MRLKKPTRAIIDQVRITREGNDAIIDYADAGIAGTRLTIGPDIATMTDRDIIDVFNGILAAQERLLAAGGAHSMSFLPPRHANLMLPISNWPKGWGRHSFLFSGAPGGTGSQEFGSRTNSTETEPFGSWMKAWRRPPRQRALLACAFSTPANSMWGLGSSCRRMRRQPDSASRA